MHAATISGSNFAKRAQEWRVDVACGTVHVEANKNKTSLEPNAMMLPCEKHTKEAARIHQHMQHGKSCCQDQCENRLSIGERGDAPVLMMVLAEGHCNQICAAQVDHT
jgi:hypothetical protein